MSNEVLNKANQREAIVEKMVKDNVLVIMVVSGLALVALAIMLFASLGFWGALSVILFVEMVTMRNYIRTNFKEELHRSRTRAMKSLTSS